MAHELVQGLGDGHPVKWWDDVRHRWGNVVGRGKSQPQSKARVAFVTRW